jgi:hypothetical protein
MAKETASGKPRTEQARPSDEDRFICIAADDLLAAMTELHSRLIHTGTPRMVAQVLLAEAHVSEAIGLLRSILPKPRAPSAVVCAQPHSPRHAARRRKTNIEGVESAAQACTNGLIRVRGPSKARAHRHGATYGIERFLLTLWASWK